MYRYVSSRSWSIAGSYSCTLSKGSRATSWIWNIHADAHDYDTDSITIGGGNQGKVLASNVAHVSMVLAWLSGMHYHGAYLSNYTVWLKDPYHTIPTGQQVWSIIGQEILLADTGGYRQGLYITSGLFSMWHASGITTLSALKTISITLMMLAMILIVGAYLHMKYIAYPTQSIDLKVRVISEAHLASLLGMGSIEWTGHLMHVSIPSNRLLDGGVDPMVIPSATALLSGRAMRSIFPTYTSNTYPEFSWSLPTGIRILSVGSTSNSYTGSIHIGHIAAHHFNIGIALMSTALWTNSNWTGIDTVLISEPRGRIYSHGSLSLALGIAGSLSITYAQHGNAMAVYPLLSSDYATAVCIFVHHIWIGGFLIVGAASHRAIMLVRENVNSSTACRSHSIQDILCHRDIITGHLVWVTIFLGMHAFGAYVHNDRMLALGRVEDIFSDNSIALRPVFSSLLWEMHGELNGVDMEVVDGKICYSWQELGTADFMVHHIHAFTIHVTVLILVKGIIYSRSSRLVSDKVTLGFRYPCDGPGRGGTCQISSWDHIYLGMFWMYNTISVVIFHFYWKMQGDVWGTI